MPYHKPRKHTAQELWVADVADLEVDILCAQRDGLTAYANTQAKRLTLLRSTAPELVERDFWGSPVLSQKP